MTKRGKGFKLLCERSNLSPGIFHPDAVAIFNAAVEVDNRHKTAHLEYDEPALLGYALALERLGRRNWTAFPAECPEVVSLRFLLCAWGATKSREVLAKLRADGGSMYPAVDEAQIDRLEVFL